MFGLIRLNKGGQIYESTYRPQEGRMGPLYFEKPISLIVDKDDFDIETASYNKKDAYRELVRWDSLCAVLIWNSELLVKVSNSRLVAIVRDSDKFIIDVGVDVRSSYNPTIPIGFIKTYPMCKDVDVPPMRLFMDTNNRVCTDPWRLHPVPDAVESEDIRLYKQLIQTDYTAVYQTKQGVKFI